MAKQKARAWKWWQVLHVIIGGALMIIGLAMTTVMVVVLPRAGRATRIENKRSLRGIPGALKLYYARHGNYPGTTDGLQIRLREVHRPHEGRLGQRLRLHSRGRRLQDPEGPSRVETEIVDEVFAQESHRNCIEQQRPLPGKADPPAFGVQLQEFFVIEILSVHREPL